MQVYCQCFLLEYKLHSRDDDVLYIWTTDDDVSCHGILVFEHYNLWLVLEIPEQNYKKRWLSKVSVK